MMPKPTIARGNAAANATQAGMHRHSLNADLSPRGLKLSVATSDSRVILAIAGLLMNAHGNAIQYGGKTAVIFKKINAFAGYAHSVPRKLVSAGAVGDETAADKPMLFKIDEVGDNVDSVAILTESFKLFKHRNVRAGGGVGFFQKVQNEALQFTVNGHGSALIDKLNGYRCYLHCTRWKGKPQQERMS